MARIKLNLSEFKYHSGDEDSTTLQHSKLGHKIILAHKSLDKDNQEQLKAIRSCSFPKEQQQEEEKKAEGGIVDKVVDTVKQSFQDEPVKPGKKIQDPDPNKAQGFTKAFKAEGGKVVEQKSPQMYAKGGESVDVDMSGPPRLPDLDQQGNLPPLPPQSEIDRLKIMNSAPLAFNSEYKAPEAAQEPAAPEQKQSAEQQQQPQAQPEQQKSQAAPAAAPAKEEAQPSAYAGPAPAAHTPEEYRDILTADFVQQSDKFKQDLLNGHITPKTFKTLFEQNEDGSPKSTLGKIGTIFGMLVSGAGAGLSHQPSVLVNMMQKEIDNDLAAQQHSKENAKNLYQLNLQHQLQEMQIPKMIAEGHLTEAQAQNAYQDAKMKALATSRSQANWGAFKKLVDLNSALPEGSQARRVGDNTLALMHDEIMKGDYDIGSKLAATAALNSGLSNAGPKTEGQFAQQNQTLRMAGKDKLADMRESHHFSGVDQVTNKPIESQDHAALAATNMLDNRAKDLLEYAKQHRGTWNPQTIARAAQKVEEMAKYYNPTIDNGGLTLGRMNWIKEQIKANPTSWVNQVFGSNAKLDEIIQSNQVNRDNLMQKYGIKGYPKASQGEQPKQEVEKSKSGKEIIYKDGKAYYK
jgi:hypothetical protein